MAQEGLWPDEEVQQALQAVPDAQGHTDVWLRFFQSMRVTAPPTTLQFCLNLFNEAVQHTVAAVPQPAAMAPPPPPAYSLRFSHICKSLTCEEAQCNLCLNDPVRRCHSDFRHKYLVNQALNTACDGRIWVSVVDRDGRLCTWSAFKAAFPGVHFKMCALPADHYLIHKRQPGGMNWTNEAELKAIGTLTCQTTANPASATPILKSLDGSSIVHDNGFLSFEPSDGDHCGMCLPLITFTRSGESIAQQKHQKTALKKKMPRMELVIRAEDCRGHVLDQMVEPAVSSHFEVATQRVKKDQKVDRPSIHDPICVIRNIGGKSINVFKKFQTTFPDVSDVPDLPATVTLVQHLMQLISVAQRHRRVLDAMFAHETLKHLKDKWKEVVEHVGQTVRPDSWHRVFFVGVFFNAQQAADAGANVVPWQERDLQAPYDVGLVFQCLEGRVQLEEAGIVRVLLRSQASGHERVVPFEVARCQPAFLTRLLDTAAIAWYRGHMGWGFYKPFEVPIENPNALPAESSIYELRGDLIAACPHPMSTELEAILPQQVAHHPHHAASNGSAAQPAGAGAAAAPGSHENSSAVENSVGSGHTHPRWDAEHDFNTLYATCNGGAVHSGAPTRQQAAARSGATGPVQPHASPATNGVEPNGVVKHQLGGDALAKPSSVTGNGDLPGPEGGAGKYPLGGDSFAGPSKPARDAERLFSFPSDLSLSWGGGSMEAAAGNRSAILAMLDGFSFPPSGRLPSGSLKSSSLLRALCTLDSHTPSSAGVSTDALQSMLERGSILAPDRAQPDPQTGPGRLVHETLFEGSWMDTARHAQVAQGSTLQLSAPPAGAEAAAMPEPSGAGAPPGIAVSPEAAAEAAAAAGLPPVSPFEAVTSPFARQCATAAESPAVGPHAMAPCAVGQPAAAPPAATGGNRRQRESLRMTRSGEPMRQYMRLVSSIMLSTGDGEEAQRSREALADLGAYRNGLDTSALFGFVNDEALEEEEQFGQEIKAEDR